MSHELPHATITYSHTWRIHCPRCDCALGDQIHDPLDLSEVPHVGDKLTCPTCDHSFVVGLEQTT